MAGPLKNDWELLKEAKAILDDLVKSREFILYIGEGGSYHKRIKAWMEDAKRTGIS